MCAWPWERFISEVVSQEIIKLLGIYRVSPPLLVVEAEDGTVVELSLKELQDGGHRLATSLGRVSWRTLSCLPAGPRRARSRGVPGKHASRGHRRAAELARLSLKPYAPPHRLNDCICPFFAKAMKGTAVPQRLKL